jgi:hypothetical protein
MVILGCKSADSDKREKKLTSSDSIISNVDNVLRPVIKKLN